LSTLECTSGSQSSRDGVEQGESPPWDTTSERRNPKWLQDTLREAHGSVGNPRQVVRESKPPERFCSYIDLVFKHINLCLTLNILEIDYQISHICYINNLV
jgi:hypothetical protein